MSKFDNEFRSWQSVAKDLSFSDYMSKTYDLTLPTAVTSRSPKVIDSVDSLYGARFVAFFNKLATWKKEKRYWRGFTKPVSFRLTDIVHEDLDGGFGMVYRCVALGLTEEPLIGETTDDAARLRIYMDGKGVTPFAIVQWRKLVLPARILICAKSSRNLPGS